MGTEALRKVHHGIHYRSPSCVSWIYLFCVMNLPYLESAFPRFWGALLSEKYTRGRLTAQTADPQAAANSKDIHFPPLPPILYLPLLTSSSADLAGLCGWVMTAVIYEEWELLVPMPFLSHNCCTWLLTANKEHRRNIRYPTGLFRCKMNHSLTPLYISSFAPHENQHQLYLPVWWYLCLPSELWV